jgi:hypothetical protein
MNFILTEDQEPLDFFLLAFGLGYLVTSEVGAIRKCLEMKRAIED